MTATQHWTVPAEPVTQPIPVVRRTNPRATAGFWLGVAGLLVGWFPVLGLLVTVPAVALSRSGRGRYRRGAAATAGRSGAGLALGVAGSVLCLLTTTLGIVGAATAPPQPAATAEVAAAAPAVPAVPVVLVVPDVVGTADAQARETLRAAGFTNVVLGPPSAATPGTPAGTVTAQTPVGAATAAAGDPITLTEAAAPVVPAAAPAQAPVVVDPDTDVDRPYVPAPARPLVAAPSAPRTQAAAPRPAAPRPAAPAPPAATDPPASGGGSAYYENCDAARAAGAAPIMRGAPGYRSALDRDDDGVACE